MVIGLLTVLLVAAAAAAVYLLKAAAPAAASEPVEILLGPQDLRQLLAPAQSKPPALEPPLSPALASEQVLRRLRELALGAAISGAPD
ncbi:MAG: hypothetical protein WBV35_21600, partial [Steroidobacteraceae bacterium]